LVWTRHPALATRVPESGAGNLCVSHPSRASDTRLPWKLVRASFPWHLGTRRLTAHRPLGVEASCLGLSNNSKRPWRPARIRALRLDLRGCCPPAGRVLRRLCPVVAWPSLGHVACTPPGGTHHIVAVRGQWKSSASGPTSAFGPKGSEKIVLQRFSYDIQS
jgi:hypothetical protein